MGRANFPPGLSPTRLWTVQDDISILPVRSVWVSIREPTHPPLFADVRRVVSPKRSLRFFTLALVSAITTPLVFAQDPLLVNPQVPSPVVVGLSDAYTSGPNVQKDREQDQRLTITSVVNGASFEPGIAPGSWVTIFGEGLAPTARIWRDDEIVGGVLPTSLDGVQVLINGKPAAIFFISPGQLNVQAPDDTTLGPVSVEVVQESGASVTTSADLQKASPAFFLFNPEGRRFLAAVHPDGVFVGKPDLFGGALPTREI